MINGHITISRPQGRDCDYITISLVDDGAGITFCDVNIKYADFAEALTGLGHVPCVFEVAGLENIGKIRQWKEFIFEVPKEYYNNKAVTYQFGKDICPEGWKLSNYFGSQNSYFTQDGKYYARGNITRWVEE